MFSSEHHFVRVADRERAFLLKINLQGIVKEEELVHYVEEGWNIVKELSIGRFLVKKTNWDILFRPCII